MYEKSDLWYRLISCLSFSGSGIFFKLSGSGSEREKEKRIEECPWGHSSSEIGSKWTKLSSLPFLPSVWLLYKSVPPNFNTDGIDTLTNKELLIPVFMKRYVQLATHSDYLRSLNRQDESESVLALAQKVLDEEIYRFETFSTKGEDIYGYR